MLLNIHIKNMALIDEIDVNFSENLNILTDFNLYRGPNKTVKEFGKNYSNFNFGTK